MTRKHKFTVIKGGGSIITPPRSYRFYSGFVTDTRLMGVLALSIHWKTGESDYPSDFHQFFYFDSEEYGLETYKSLTGEDQMELDIVEQALIGGLGGTKVEISEKEARFLIQSFVAEGKRLNAPLPEPKTEYEFLLEDPIVLSVKEKQCLVNKICTPLFSKYQMIHYFLMRCLAKDQKGASYLMNNEIPLDNIWETNPVTLCRNSIEEYIDCNGHQSYLCEALTEDDGKYNLIVFEITVSDDKVSSVFRRCSFRVTSAEAGMLLNRPEFITIYEILTDPDNFDETFLPLVRGAMLTTHDNGRLFLEFNKDNDHVNKKVFRLNEDIHGMYYVTDYGQLILAAYGLNEIRALEKSLQKSSMYKFLLPTAKYEFKEPILYEFIQSDFEDFTEFLETIK